MKKLIFGYAMAMCGLMSVASADYCCPVQCDPCCYETGFDGLYIGGNVGAITHTAHRNDLDGALTDNSGWTINNTNVTAGVQLGYDWQCCNSLFGLVVDWNWVNTRSRLRDNVAVDDGNFIDSRFHWFTTIRARAGLTVCDALVYVTGGAAVAHFHNRWADLGTFEFRDHHNKWGWTAGVGTEFMLGCNWSIGAEILWLEFDDHRRTFADGVNTFNFSHSDQAWIGRIALNYRFGDLCCLW